MNYRFLEEELTPEEITHIIDYETLSYQEKIDIIKGQIIEEDTIRRHPEFMRYKSFDIPMYQRLPMDILATYYDAFYEDQVEKYQVLTEDFMRNFKDRLNWSLACVFQAENMSYDFIDEMDGYIDWDMISKHKQLSEEFILSHMDKLNIDLIMKHQFISRDFLQDLFDYVTDENNTIWQNYVNKDYIMRRYVYRGDNWTTSKEEWTDKLTYVKGLELYDDYFIGKKLIRNNRYSLSNFGYKYDVGNTLTTWSDYSMDDISFGFGVFNEQGLSEYFIDVGVRNKTIKVKVNYEDITYLSHYDKKYKIRCSKLEVVS